jgi:hypothetical protein
MFGIIHILQHSPAVFDRHCPSLCSSLWKPTGKFLSTAPDQRAKRRPNRPG